ncbi:helix-turn-helix domain-containing protein [Streptomyces sp. NPDC002490]|uniref:IclR family transcriptional regulator n=1 Tax=Streptomyces sp. NPDC002490 TaxID=3154416 RepID=UPI00332E193B
MQRALRLLEAAASRPEGAPAKQLAREAGVALPTAYHLLRTLAHEGYVRRERGVYRLAEAAGRLGGAGAQQNRRSMIQDALAHCHDLLGAPVYFGVYRKGEIELVAVADSPAHPAVEEWADFRETGHAHALGQCLLSQLGEKARRDHLHRHPVRYVTPYSVRDEESFLRRLAAVDRMQPVLEHQEYALGTVCAALPLMVGTTAMAIGFSLPAHQEDRLLPMLARLEREVGRLLGTPAFSISI